MLYTLADDISIAEDEFESYNYSYTILDPSGEVMALACTEESAEAIVAALNSALNPHEKG